jgi:integrase
MIGMELGGVLNTEELSKLLQTADAWIEAPTTTARKGRAGLRERRDTLCHRRSGLMVWLAVTTGLRESEIARLQWQDITWENQTMLVWRHKKRKARPGTRTRRRCLDTCQRDRINLPDALVTRLQKMRREQGPVIQAILPRPRRDEETAIIATCAIIRRDFRRILNAAGLRHRRVHDLRHTFATHLYDKTLDLLLVRDMLCHASVRTTEVYTRARNLKTGVAAINQIVAPST